MAAAVFTAAVVGVVKHGLNLFYLHPVSCDWIVGDFYRFARDSKNSVFFLPPVHRSRLLSAFSPND
jgi:hypothetical protein